MTNKAKRMGDAFHMFLTATPQLAHAWMTAMQKLDAASALDKKTKHSPISRSRQYFA